MGEEFGRTEKFILASAAVSVPVDLTSAAVRLGQASARFYEQRFIRSLTGRIRKKYLQFPHSVPDPDRYEIKTIYEFDDIITAPLNGFANAGDYYRKSSSQHFLEKINKSTLLIQAADDPFLGASCYPFSAARKNPFFHLEVTPFGGHVGFIDRQFKYWSEIKIEDFLTKYL